jgi:biofilm regulator BssS
MNKTPDSPQGTADEEIPVFPVSAWEIGPVPSLGMVLIRFGFLSHQLQKPNESQWDRRYALSPEITRKLIAELGNVLDRLEKLGPQAPPGPKQ